VHGKLLGQKGVNFNVFSSFTQAAMPLGINNKTKSTNPFQKTDQLKGVDLAMD